MAQEDNPFAPSASVDGDGAPDRVDTLDPVPMDVGEILSRCWLVFNNNKGVVIAALVAQIAPGILFGATGAVIDALAESASGDIASVMPFLSLGNTILQQLVTLFFALGAVRVFIHVTRGQQAEVGMIVGEGRAYLPALGAQLLIALAMFVAVSPGFAALAAAGLGAVGLTTAMLVFAANVAIVVIPWIVVSIGLQFVLYVIVDRGVGPIEAIRESWRLTDGYKGTIFGINLLAGVLALLFSCLTLGIGSLLIMPVFVLMQGVMYHSLTHYKGLVDDVAHGEARGAR